MTYSVLVEPADENRPGFARWCLAQDPQIMTTNAQGSHVPAALFPDVPEALLVGARVDGREYRYVVEGKVPDGDGYRLATEDELPKKIHAAAIAVPVDDGARPEPVAAAPRRRTRKATTPKDGAQ